MSKHKTFMFLALAGLVMLALLVAACAPAATPTPVVVEKPVVVTATPEPTKPPAPVTIRYFTFSAAPDHLKDLDEMIAIFEKANPGIKIKVETAPFSEYFSKLLTMIAGGTAPDVFELNYENFVSFAAKGVLLDLGPLAKADKEFKPEIFYPRAYNAFNLNGLQFGLPETFSTVVLFYNKDLFDKAGLAYPAANWTWKEAVTAAKKMTDPKAGVWGLYSPIQFWEFYKKASQNGCNFFSPDKKKVTLDAPECVEALETMVSFVTKDKVMPSDAEMGGVSDGDLFKAGKIAMDVTGIWMFGAFKDARFKWDIQVEPGLKQQATHFFANAVSVFAATKHPQAAWQWVKFFTTSPDMAKIRVKSGWELPALSNPAFFEDYLKLSPPANRAAVFKSLEYAIVPPVIERQGEMQDSINKLLDKVKLGQLTPKAALEQAKKEVEALMR
ncbi:MAG: sugar ABC transporter substrate-binding protein [Chloroflexota bacterium]